LKGRKHGDTVTLATFQSWHRANPFTQGNPMNTRGLPNSCSEPKKGKRNFLLCSEQELLTLP
jgi:hypothetical protein